MWRVSLVERSLLHGHAGSGRHLRSRAAHFRAWPLPLLEHRRAARANRSERAPKRERAAALCCAFTAPRRFRARGHAVLSHPHSSNTRDRTRHPHTRRSRGTVRRIARLPARARRREWPAPCDRAPLVRADLARRRARFGRSPLRTRGASYQAAPTNFAFAPHESVCYLIRGPRPRQRRRRRATYFGTSPPRSAGLICWGECFTYAVLHTQRRALNIDARHRTAA